MNVLHVVSSWPTREKPYVKPFIVAQIEALRSNDISIDVINLNATTMSINYILGALRIVRRVMFAEYDLIHAHYGYCGWSAILQRKVPVIVSFMGNDVFGILNDRGGQTIVGLLNIISSRILLRFIAAAIVKSNRMKEMINSKHVFVVPNGVDFAFFRPFKTHKRQTPNSTGVKKILFLGGPKSREKNISLAREALELVKIINQKVELLAVFGVDQKKVVDLMNNCDVLLVTSLQEGSPNVIKEAMACNCPIVSTDVGDVREIVGDTKGCYITGFKPQEIAQTILQAIEYGKRTDGRRHIRYLEANEIAKRIIGIYRNVLSHSR